MRKLILSFLVSGLAFLSAPSSLAHGEITSSFPQADSVEATVPTEVWIDFDGPLQTIDGQEINSLEVIDSSGTVVNEGELVIEGGNIWTKLSDQTLAGAFTVNYRIVSVDGHPVEGSYSFGAAPEMAMAYSTRAGGETEATPELTSATPDLADTGAESKNNTALTIGGIIVVLLLGAIGIKVLVQRKNLK
jgi:methionine-rich copper-binding protein CopC